MKISKGINKMSKAIIITSFIESEIDITRHIRNDSFVICTDGGYDIASAHGIKPDLLLGDFDSIESELPKNVKIERFSPEKDYTDLDLALKTAVSSGSDDVTILGGIGGLAYTVAAGSGFNSDVGGYGFLALAVMIFGNWKPLPILGASLFFALFKVIAALNSTLSFLPKFEGVKEISNFYQMLPYIVTMIVLIFTSKNSQAPKAEGIPYDKGSR